MEKYKFNLPAQNSITGFVPGALCVMLLSIMGISIFSSQSVAEHLRALSWRVLFLELTCLALGYTIMVLAFSSRLRSSAQMRGVIAGVISVFVLGLLSVFTQGVHLPMIAISSAAAGMISALILLVPDRLK
ncbi:MAG TPA: hypothetical protein PLK30_15045 [Blastocatellia bacterium]|nr:hypothetical protein [Blastocatellia bacterium]